MGEGHRCDNMPDAVEVYESDEGWVIGYLSHEYAGFDESVFAGLTMRIYNVTHCPFCGAKVVE